MIRGIPMLGPRGRKSSESFIKGRFDLTNPLNSRSAMLSSRLRQGRDGEVHRPANNLGAN